MKRSTLVFSAIIIALTSIVAAQWYMILLSNARQAGAYDALLQISDKNLTLISSGKLSKEDSQELRTAMVPVVMNITIRKPDGDFYSSLSPRALLGLCGLIRNSEKLFPEESDPPLNPLDKDIFPILRGQLQALRPVLEGHISSRQDVGTESLAGCHWATRRPPSSGG
jgi:hypothetical protein